jgi:hypothetical protein
VTISPAHSGTIVQESGEIWTAKTRLQPILPKSDASLNKQVTHLPVMEREALAMNTRQMLLLQGYPDPFQIQKEICARVERKFVLTANAYTH